MAEGVYNLFMANLANGEEDWEADDHEALLLTGSATFNEDADTVTAALASNTEASDGSYSRVALTSESVTNNDTDDRAQLDADDLDFGSLTGETPTAMIIYRLVTNDGDSIPISFHDTGFGSVANGAGYTVEFPTQVIRLSSG